MNKANFRFGTVGAPKSTPKKPGGSIGAILAIAELGLKAFELGWVRSVRVSEKTCAKIKEQAEEHDVTLSVHAPYYINLNADQEEWPKSRQRLMDAAHYGYLAGAGNIIFHPGSYFGRSPEDVLKVAIPRLRGCVEALRDQDNPVILRPETMGKGAMLGSLKDTLIMSAEIEGVEPCLDFAHLHARAGDGSINSYKEWVDILEIYAEHLGPSALKQLHCHLSGIEYTPKGERNHLMLPDSDLVLEDLLKALWDQGCKGVLLCESPDQERDALFIKQVWEKIRGDNA
jgi:deoxyribonuclease-4